MKKILLVVVAILGVLAAPAGASYITYSDEATFLGAAGSLNMESFEGFKAGTYATINAADFSISSNGVLNIWDVPAFGTYPTDGVNFVAIDAGGSTVFNFSSAVNAFGINIIDWGDYGSGKLAFFNNASIVQTIAYAPQADGNQMFFGIIDDTLVWDQVILMHDIPGEGYAVDEVYYGKASPNVPEPATLLLLGGGLFGGIVARRRRS